MAAELGHLGNPSSLHAAGRRARRVVEESREQLAEVFGARPSEVVFTSGGTEADNLAVKGLYWARQDERPAAPVLTTSVEHHAILTRSGGWRRPRALRRPGWRSATTAWSSRRALRAAIAQAPEQVAMVSVMWANNEVGAVQPVSELAAVAHEYGVPFHTDAVQAAAQLPVDFAASGADALTVTGHKLGGPVGVGALILARGAAPVPVLHGGGQERDIRSGTLDTPAIRAFARGGRGVRQAARRGGRTAGRAARRPGAPGAGRQCPTRRSTARPPRTAPAAGQRALLLPRLRGRRPAHAARRERHRLLHRFGLHRGRGRTQPRAAGHGRRRRARPRLAPLLRSAHLHQARRRRPRPGHPAR